MAEFCAMASKYADLGPLYQPTEQMLAMAENGSKYFN